MECNIGLIYVLGVMSAIITLIVRNLNNRANLFESVYSPVLAALSWVYVIIVIINCLERKR